MVSLIIKMLVFVLSSIIFVILFVFLIMIMLIKETLLLSCFRVKDVIHILKFLIDPNWAVTSPQLGKLTVVKTGLIN